MNDTYKSAHTDFKDGFSYTSYLKLEQLLGAQECLTEAHDEPLFMIVHHVQELWMKLIIHELSSAMQQLELGIIDPAMKMPARVSRAQEQMANAWEVLKTMTPSDYLVFRNAFGQASGFQSHQYRLIEFLFSNKNAFMMRPHTENTGHYALLENALNAPSIYDLSLRLLHKAGLAQPLSSALKVNSVLEIQSIKVASKNHTQKTSLCNNLWFDRHYGNFTWHSCPVIPSHFTFNAGVYQSFSGTGSPDSAFIRKLSKRT